MMKLIIILVVLLCYVAAHKCGHDVITENIELPRIIAQQSYEMYKHPGRLERRVSNNNAYSTIRIKLNTTFLELDPELRQCSTVGQVCLILYSF